MNEPQTTFLKWFNDNGGRIHPSVELASSDAGHMFRVKSESSNIELDSIIISCPSELTISFQNAQRSSSLNGLVQKNGQISVEPIVALRFFLIEQYLLRDESLWFAYLQLLPQPSDHQSLHVPFLFDEDDLRWLEDTNLGKAVELRKSTWKKEYKVSIGLLQDIDLAFPHHCTLELYTWAATMLNSRSFPFKSPINVNENLPALIPGLDLLNHSQSSMVTWDFTPSGCTIRNDSILSAGSEVFNNYGAKSNEELLIAYGFCLHENKADYFGLGFNQATSHHIRHTLLHRDEPSASNEGLERPDSAGNVEAIVLEQHKLYIDTTEDPPFGFSDDFLLHSSIAVENPRETAGHRHDWAHGRSALTSPMLCRNHLHAFTATTILLEKSLHEISSFDRPAYRIPGNHRQSLARMYRDGQVAILELTLQNLHSGLKRSLQEGSCNGILQLDHVLGQLLPPRTTKDIRDAVHVALGTRKVEKICEMGAEECVFTLFVYAILILQKTGQLIEYEGHQQLARWIENLQLWYGQPQEYAAGEEVEVLARSYVEALETTVTKHKRNLLKDGEGVESLGWCLHVVRGESVRVPIPDRELEVEESEMVLFLEV